MTLETPIRLILTFALIASIGLLPACPDDGSSDTGSDGTLADSGADVVADTDVTDADVADADPPDAADIGGEDAADADIGGEDAADADASGDSDAGAVLEGLAACPNPLVIQTDWLPEPEHGAVYQLTRGEGSFDPETGRFQGPLAADPSLTIEIRIGGPFNEFAFMPFLLRDDPSVFLGYLTTNLQVVGWDLEAPTVAVVAPLEKSPEMLMWDPATYDFQSFSDIAASDAVVNVFDVPQWVEYLWSTDQLTMEQTDLSFDGTPNRFIAEAGAIVQQGWATQDPWRYQNQYSEWGAPIDLLLIHDSGWQPYTHALALTLIAWTRPLERASRRSFLWSSRRRSTSWTIRARSTPPCSRPSRTSTPSSRPLVGPSRPISLPMSSSPWTSSGWSATAPTARWETSTSTVSGASSIR